MDVHTNRKAGFREFILDLFFPNRCPFCGGFIRYDRYCCEDCFSAVLWADEHICRKCGKPVRNGCGCSNSPSYDMCVAAAYYSGTARKGIYSLKFRSNLNSAAVFGRALRDQLITGDVLKDISIAVPVPMSARQKKQRGYNQAEELAKVIVSDTDIPVRTDLLSRKYSRISQHSLGADERKSAADNAYCAVISGTPLTGMTVLLVDDVLTTGSTLDRCASLLKELGAEKVICAAAATV